MLFVPIGMETLIHKKPSRRKKFANYCVEAYDLGTSPKHYRCWNLGVKESSGTRVSGTLFYKYITNDPAVTPEDADMVAANNLVATLKGKMPQHLQESSLQALMGLQGIFSQAAHSNKQG